MTKSVILTGLRANNDLTLGNYFGGMLPIIDMAKRQAGEYQVNMFIPDLHSFTTPIDHSELQAQVMNNARLYAAAGLPLDHENIHIYRQSYIPAHSELTWILDCFTGMGEMSRMTQFKDKRTLTSEKDAAIRNKYKPLINTIVAALDRERMDKDLHDALSQMLEHAVHNEINEATVSSVGLFNYPVLMAADILLYSATYIPVGDDQTQHLEFARDIAERINKKFGNIFTIPEPVAKQHEFFGSSRGSEHKNHQGLRIMDLVDPTKKMSKSDESGKGVVFLGDNPEVAAKKIMSATTDDKASVNYNPSEQPGISNLIEILSLLRGESISTTEASVKGMNRYGDFKKIVANEVQAFLTNFQVRLAEVDDTALITKLEASERTMNIQANATLLRAQQAVGLRPKGVNG